MKDKKSSSKFREFVRRVFPYLVMFAVILTMMIIGSREDQKIVVSSTVLNVISDNNFTVTADQLTESFIVADMARAFDLPSSSRVSENFVSIAIRYDTPGNVDTATIEKPMIIDTSNLARGILRYVVQAGDKLPDIAARFGLTATQVRWSNNMRSDAVTVGQTLFLPSAPGILYTVRVGDTLENLAERYKSNASQIKSLNDLELSGLVVGQTIILPNGVLPERERPEYVRPTPRPSFNMVLTDSGARHDMREIGSRGYWMGVSSPGNPSTRGQCTWFAWWWRRTNMPENYWLPTGVIGNARDWVRNLSSRYVVNQTPAYGAVVQTRSSNWGHVAIVTGVTPGEYIVMQEMNWNYQTFRVYESRVNWADAVKWVYIHGAR